MDPEAAPTARTFLSYARRDGALADRVFDALGAAGLDVFRDSEDILPGEDWRNRLGGLIAAADAILFLLSPNSAASEVCAWELDQAVALNKRIVPVVIHRVADGEAPARLERLNYIFATPDDDLAKAVEAIEIAVGTDIDWVREHTRLYERAAEWERNGDNARLLSGAPLETAERWLASQPETGPPPLPLHREWIASSRQATSRRQRRWVIGASAVAVMAIGLGIFAEINRQIAAAERDRAERILDRGSKTANDLVFDLAQRFRDREGVPQDLVLDILGRSKNLVDQFSEVGEGRPDLLRSRAASLTELSLTLLRQGDLDQALITAQEATEEFEKIAALSDGDPNTALDLAVSHDRLGDVHFANDDLDQAELAYRTSLEFYQRIRETAGTGQHPENVAVALEKLGTVALAREDGQAALEKFETALKEATRSDDAARQIAILNERIGDAQGMLDQTDAAIASYQTSLKQTEALARQAPKNTELQRDLSVIHQKLGALFLAQEGFDDALDHFRADLEIVERLRGSDQTRADWLNDQIVSLDRLGIALYYTGDDAAAENTLATALRLARQRAQSFDGRDDFLIAASKAAQKLALVASENGNVGLSLTTSQDIARDLRARHAKEPAMAPYLADALNNVAWYSLFTDEPSSALVPVREAIRLEPETLGFHLNLAHALALSGDIEGALNIHEEHRHEAEWVDMTHADIEIFKSLGIGLNAFARIENLYKE